jgi:hypothetical protein
MSDDQYDGLMEALISLRDATASGFARVDHDMQVLRHDMNRRFDLVDDRFDEVDRRFDRLESRVGGIEGHLGLPTP